MISSLSEQQKMLKISQSCRLKYPNMVPVQVKVQEGLVCHREKFFISEKITGLELQRNILSKVQRQITQTLYFFVLDGKKHRMLQKNMLIGDVFSLYKNQQGFLLIKVMKENVF